MGLPNTSRKGKKAWRKNIDATEVEEFREQETHQERRGPAVEALKDDELFFIDKTADEAEAQAVATGQRRKRREAALAKPLRSQLILQAAHTAKPVLAQKGAPRKVGPLSKRHELVAKAAGQAEAPVAAPAKKDGAELDLWASTGNEAEEGRAEPGPSSVAAAAAAKGGSSKVARRRKSFGLAAAAAAPLVKAVEVDMAGCSYNPDPELHQDALAALVASEMKKVLKKDLAPVAPPQTMDEAALAEGGDELDRLQTVGDEDDENEIPLDEDAEEEEAAGGSRAAKDSKKTTKDRNREKRRIEAEKELAGRKQLKRMRRDIDNLKSLASQMEEEEQEKAARRQRKEIVKAEKASSQPPRLGKLKFEAPAVQVLTSDELSGSLRTVKAFPMVAADRFKSLQKRGMIEPRKPQALRMARKAVEYEKNARTERAQEGQDEIDAMRKHTKALNKEAAQQKLRLRKQQEAQQDLVMGAW